MPDLKLHLKSASMGQDSLLYKLTEAPAVVLSWCLYLYILSFHLKAAKLFNISWLWGCVRARASMFGLVWGWWSYHCHIFVAFQSLPVLIMCSPRSKGGWYGEVIWMLYLFYTAPVVGRLIGHFGLHRHIQIHQMDLFLENSHQSLLTGKKRNELSIQDMLLKGARHSPAARIKEGP